VLSAPSLNAFKGRLDKFWDNYQFSLDPDTFSTTRLLISQKAIKKHGVSRQNSRQVPTVRLASYPTKEPLGNLLT